MGQPYIANEGGYIHFSQDEEPLSEVQHDYKEDTMLYLAFSEANLEVAFKCIFALLTGPPS